ncbi:MAG TPA: DUF6066 family protein [Anaeromyxobacter sp.]|nr:DUF6066 family protein [Anaeromyxobacter sp.]
MRSAALVALFLLLPPSAQAAEQSFDTLARNAERVDALETFLSRFVGRCTDVYERQKCEANVAEARRQISGRAFAVRVTDAASLVRPERRGQGYLLLVTPFFAGGDLALTSGVPKKQDPEGRPVVDLLPIPGAVPPGMMEMEFESPFRTGAIELEVVFRPEKVWRLSRRGEKGSYEGVAARLLAVRVIDSRTGNEIASRVM